MLTLTPEETALENHDVFSRQGWTRPAPAPGLTQRSYWGTWNYNDGAARTGLLTPSGVHNLLMMPFAWRNPDPVNRPFALSPDEVFLEPVTHQQYSISNLSWRYNTLYSGWAPHHQAPAVSPGAPWQAGVRNGVPELPVHPDTRYTAVTPENRLVPGPDQYADLAAFYEAFQDQAKPWLAGRNRMLAKHDGSLPWYLYTPTPTQVNNTLFPLEVFRNPLFALARATAARFGLQIEDALYYLQGIDEQLAIPFVLYFHHSLQAVLKKSDHYLRHNKRETEFLNSVSELRIVSQHHRADIANGLRTLWDQHNARMENETVPYGHDKIVEARHQIEAGFKGMVKWYMTFPSAYEDLVIDHGGPSSVEVVPDMMDFDERLERVRTDLMTSRRARHLLRSAV